ncbi:MAG: S46 family peptidase [Prevotellaceae bacterium]|jgi:hypothetical protein|nr:S46 family peptidase [Prevotellaceae bacterium]
MKKILSFIVGLLILASTTLRADEGMWFLPLLEKLNIKDMKKSGCQLTAEQIYSINKSSLKDAVVHFGGGCTGEMISSEGLLLTNHHCGYGQIQRLSSVENDYLQDGFWAMSKSEELMCEGLTVTFLERIEDITGRILPELDKTATEEERAKRFMELSKEITDPLTLDSKGERSKFIRAYVVPLYGGNVYYLFVSKIYRDVRLVGAPPSSIGKFGGDTDNWIWPRHTGDFSIFRVYADKNGNPAEPSKDNVPYKPKNYFKVSLKGVKEGDFAMVMGYPGRTYRYMTSYELKELVKTNDTRVIIRGARQDVWQKDMRSDQKIRIQYSSKYAGSSNYWKNSIGMNEALAKLDVINTREKGEVDFRRWVNENPQRKAAYGEALDLIAQAVAKREDARLNQLIITECLYRTEVIGAAASLGLGLQMAYQKNDAEAIKQAINSAKERSVNFFKDYNVATDIKAAQVILPLYVELTKKENRPDFFETIESEYNNNAGWYIIDVITNSMFASREKFDAFMCNPNLSDLEKDPAMKTLLSINAKFKDLGKDLNPAADLYSKGFRMYMTGLMEMNKGKAIYPDANSTMRLTYGNVKSYSPRDGVEYEYLTTLTGVIEKEDSNNWEFIVPDKLKELYRNKDYGQYGQNGTQPVNFIFNGDITGGNSGSPVLNGKGEIIGLAFDGNWEALSGDVLFEPDLQRCINVDIRYVLFIIDKYAGAKHLINEMTLVK